MQTTAGVRRQHAAVLQLHAGADAVLQPQRHHTPLQKTDAAGAGVLYQRIDDIHRLIRAGEHPVSPLGFQRHPQFFEQMHGILPPERGTGRCIKKRPLEGTWQ